MRSSPAMTLRPWFAGFLLFSAVLRCPIAAQEHPKNTKTRVVHGHMEESSAYHGPLLMYGNLHQYRYTQTADFTFVEEFNALGYQRWLSGTVTWSAQGESRLIEVPNVWSKCHGHGTLNFGAQRPNSGLPLEDIKFTCEHPEQGPSVDAEAFKGPPTTLHWNICMPQEDECSCQEERIVTGAPPVKIRTSTTVSSEIDAVMQVKTKKGDHYWNFVPEPGNTIKFSVSSNPPARFKFELRGDEVSHFPGYAMNADVDDEFFRRFPLEHLNGKYRNDDADLIFDPQQHPGPTWKQPAHGDVVETVKPSSEATVTVTAMDFGAYGKLRASVIGGACRGEHPVRILVDGKESKDPWVTIPLDKDGNLIADRMDEEKGYKGDPGRDDDQDPRGDGTAGDGFTAFEEYRGFMVAGSPDCSQTEHIRTNPDKKDLFIYTEDPELAFWIESFAWRSGLDVHRVCKRNLQDSTRMDNEWANDEARIVNFTLQKHGLKTWANKTISQENPQHLLYLRNAKLTEGHHGETRGVGDGSPKDHSVVLVDKKRCIQNGGQLFLDRVVSHELGHGVGIRHHGDLNIPTENAEPKIEGPIVLINMTEGGMPIDFPSCPRGSVKGSVNGKTSCMFNMIAVRDGQNSGEQTCAMKYMWWDWYVPAGAALTPLNQRMEFKSGFLHLKSRTLPVYVMSPLTAKLKPYNKRIDAQWLNAGKIRQFCVSKKGTGINSGPENHAGDATVGLCANQIHVNDVK